MTITRGALRGCVTFAAAYGAMIATMFSISQVIGRLPEGDNAVIALIVYNGASLAVAGATVTLVASESVLARAMLFACVPAFLLAVNTWTNGFDALSAEIALVVLGAFAAVVTGAVLCSSAMRRYRHRVARLGILGH